MSDIRKLFWRYNFLEKKFVIYARDHTHTHSRTLSLSLCLSLSPPTFVLILKFRNSLDISVVLVLKVHQILVLGTYFVSVQLHAL